tara:strand:+ start:50059 stop:50214 length:156 start_codon:yes stop_codon:yes gene_type:complete
MRHALRLTRCLIVDLPIFSNIGPLHKRLPQFAIIAPQKDTIALLCCQISHA